MPDLPDYRDHLYAAPPLALASLPPKVDFRPFFGPPGDQGRIGSSAACAVADAIRYDRLRGGRTPDFAPSRLFLYYNARKIARHLCFDSGAGLRDVIKCAAKFGVCPETEWPYDDTPAPMDGGAFPTDARAGRTPTEECYELAERYRVSQYQRVIPTLNQLKGCLASGFPFVFGFTVFESFVDKSGRLNSMTPRPAPGEDPLGGHCALCVGFDESKQYFIVRNSWGTTEGENGYFYMPYAYMTDPGLCGDFWTIRTISF
jgi:C1A family cysteine protease